MKRYLIKVAYRELNYGFVLQKEAEYLVPRESVTKNSDGSIQVIPTGRKGLWTFASSMIKLFLEVN